ncbi:MAG TPA: prenyltransferase/squalene oxidase repeat-containing protein [Caulifigura sp.]|jgi:hypothetical protein|nr:prenyltransferase/squalene oxidase repeat-containing protein [Caulifigura sp.]
MRPSAELSRLRLWLTAPMLLLLVAVTSHADENRPSQAAIRKAVERSLPLLSAGAKGVLDHKRQCFMCHNQALPVFAMVTAADRGFPLDRDLVQKQLQHTVNFLDRNRERYLKGEGQGGQADMAGYALWMLDVGGWKPDDTTGAVAEYFLKYQAEKDHWTSVSDRPPSEKSPFTASYVSLRALSRYGTAEQTDRIEQRRTALLDWLLATPAVDTEDHVFRLRGLHEASAKPEHLRQAADNLLKLQREDGGWAQDSERGSDAYATGSALVALEETGQLKTSDPVCEKGVAFLLGSQLEDGSWHVVSHSKPFQTYFESGYPHGPDQFISIAAAGWATTALALALPRDPQISGENSHPPP